MTREEAAKVLKLERDSLRKNPKVKVDRRLYDAFDVAIKDLENHWIPVSKRLPEKDGEYLVTMRNFLGLPQYIEALRFATDLHKIDKYDFPEYKSGFYGSDLDLGYYEVDRVLAWMPLPEPYKEE